MAERTAEHLQVDERPAPVGLPTLTPRHPTAECTRILAAARHHGDTRVVIGVLPLIGLLVDPTTTHEAD